MKIVPLNEMIHEMIGEFEDFRDYDDANIIKYYESRSEEAREGIDNIFAYLCGETLGNIIDKYNQQYDN